MTPPLTIAEVAARRRVSVDTVQAWIDSGELVATHEGTGKRRATWRVELADLEAFLEGRRTRPAGRPAPRRQTPAAFANATRYFR